TGYARAAADEAGFEAAYLAKEIGRPVRMQWMRNEETAWDTKGPAYAVTMRGALDAQGNLTALEWTGPACRPRGGALDAQGTLTALEWNGRACDQNHVGYNEPDSVLIAQLSGQHRAQPARGTASTASDLYVIPNQRTLTHVVGLPLLWETPIRTGNLRDPDGPQVTFASESFIDELAAAAKAVPVEFRLRLLTASTADDSGFKRARSIAVIKAAAEKFGWAPRP